MRDQRLIVAAMIAVLAVIAGCGQVRRSATDATAVPASDPDASAVYLNVDGTLLAAAPDGAGGWFIGGRFTRVAGQRRPGLAHVAANGELDPTWSPVAKGRARYPQETLLYEPEVSALLVVGDTVYVGGLFTSINGRPRKHLAAVNARTGRLLAWNPRPNWEVGALAAASETVYVGGLFTRMGRASRGRLAAFDATTGALTAWNPGVTGRVREATEPEVTALLPDRGRLYAGGRFTKVGGRYRGGLAAFDVATGALTAWRANAGDVFAVAVSGDTVYAGGGFTEVFAGPDDDTGVERLSLAAFDARTGRLLRWRADAVDESNSPSLVYQLAVVGDRLYVRGVFDELAGEPHENLGVVSAITGAPIPWRPRPSHRDRYSLVAAGDRVLVGGDFNNDDG